MQALRMFADGAGDTLTMSDQDEIFSKEEQAYLIPPHRLTEIWNKSDEKRRFKGTILIPCPLFSTPMIVTRT